MAESWLRANGELRAAPGLWGVGAPGTGGQDLLAAGSRRSAGVELKAGPGGDFELRHGGGCWALSK